LAAAACLRASNPAAINLHTFLCPSTFRFQCAFWQ